MQHNELSHTVSAFRALPAAALDILRPIEDEAAYQNVMTVIDDLSQIIGEDDTHPLAGVYSTLIEHAAAYEERAYPVPSVPPHELVAFLMEQQNISQTDLAHQLSIDQSNVSRLLSGKKRLTTELVKKLADIFHVSPTTFLV